MGRRYQINGMILSREHHRDGVFAETSERAMESIPNDLNGEFSRRRHWAVFNGLWNHGPAPQNIGGTAKGGFGSAVYGQFLLFKTEENKIVDIGNDGRRRVSAFEITRAIVHYSCLVLVPKCLQLCLIKDTVVVITRHGMFFIKGKGILL
jgi:hypothetical protein